MPNVGDVIRVVRKDRAPMDSILLEVSVLEPDGLIDGIGSDGERYSGLRHVDAAPVVGENPVHCWAAVEQA